jgi:hypothetical protein
MVDRTGFPAIGGSGSLLVSETRSLPRPKKS